MGAPAGRGTASPVSGAGAVLVGGPAALHAGHRRSLDGDHVLEDLRPRFDEVLAALERPPVADLTREETGAILGSLDGVMTGIRQLRRTRRWKARSSPG